MERISNSKSATDTVLHTLSKTTIRVNHSDHTRSRVYRVHVHWHLNERVWQCCWYTSCHMFTMTCLPMEPDTRQASTRAHTRSAA
jgi:hypothetical protein